MEFASDGRRVRIATVSGGTIWDLRNRGAATKVASFDGFDRRVTGIGYWPATDEFVVLMDAESLVRLRTDVEQVARERCRESAMSLSDEEWAKYVPDVERMPVC